MLIIHQKQNKYSVKEVSVTKISSCHSNIPNASLTFNRVWSDILEQNDEGREKIHGVGRGTDDDRS